MSARFIFLLKSQSKVSSERAEARQLVASIKRPILSPAEFVAYERGHQIDRCHFLGLRLTQACVQHGGHA